MFGLGAFIPKRSPQWEYLLGWLAVNWKVHEHCNMKPSLMNPGGFGDGGFGDKGGGFGDIGGEFG